VVWFPLFFTKRFNSGFSQHLNLFEDLHSHSHLQD
jgi:hypothetical protein